VEYPASGGLLPSHDPSIYGIFVPDVTNGAWHTNNANTFADVPVTIFDEASSINIDGPILE